MANIKDQFPGCDGWFPVPHALFNRDSKLSASERLIIVMLIKGNGNQEWCWFSDRYIAKCTGLSRSTCQRALANLVVSNTIIRQARKAGNAIAYAHKIDHHFWERLSKLPKAKIEDKYSFKYNPNYQNSYVTLSNGETQRVPPHKTPEEWKNGWEDILQQEKNKSARSKYKKPDLTLVTDYEEVDIDMGDMEGV